MEINEQTLNEIIFQRNVPNMKNIYASKAKKHILGTKKQISTSKKDIINLAKKINRRLIIKNRGEDWTAEKWLWKQQKLFVWIIIYYSEVKFLQLNSFGQRDFLILNKLFPLKSPQFLRYEYYLTFCVDRDLRVTWNQNEIQLFDKILKEQQDQKNLYHWKNISYLLFRQSEGSFFKSAQSCRNRWENHSNPNLNKKLWSMQEDIKLLHSTNSYGSKWAKIARQCFEGRTQHMIKNRYRCLVKKYQLDGLSVEESSKILMQKIVINPHSIMKDDSQSLDSSKHELQTQKEQHKLSIIDQHQNYKKQIIEYSIQQEKISNEQNMLTIDEILSFSKQQQKLHLKFQSYEEQWFDGLMNQLQIFSSNNTSQGDYC